MKLFVGLIFLIVIWYAVTEFFNIPPLLLPSPERVLNAYRPVLVDHSLASIGRALIGFSFGVALAYAIHLLCVIIRAADAMDQQFAVARAIPVISIMPLLIVWFGFSEIARVGLVALTAQAYFLAPLHESYRAMPAEVRLLRKQLGIWRFGYYVRVVMPWTLGELLGSLRIALAVSLTVAIASDYIGSQFGIGKFIDSARITFNTPGIVLGILISGCIGVTLDQMLSFSFRKLVHWTGRTAKA